MKAWLAFRRFNYIDALGINIGTVLIYHEHKLIAGLLVVALMTIISVIIERDVERKRGRERKK